MSAASGVFSPGSEAFTAAPPGKGKSSAHQHIHWPCQGMLPEAAEQERLHSWRVTPTLGCFVCRGCRLVGVCPACYAEAGHVVPRIAVQMCCPKHRRGASVYPIARIHALPGAGAQPANNSSREPISEMPSTPDPLPSVSTERPRQERETPTCGIFAARNWVALLERAEAIFAEVAADEHTPSAQRPDLWRQVKRAFDSLARYEHQMEPRARRLARELLWRRTTPDLPLPPFAPPHDVARSSGASGSLDVPQSREPSLVYEQRRRIARSLNETSVTAYRRDWERCTCLRCFSGVRRLQDTCPVADSLAEKQ